MAPLGLLALALSCPLLPGVGGARLEVQRALQGARARASLGQPAPPMGPVAPSLERFVVPPPPPRLEPWASGQPGDVGIGELLVNNLVEQPTVTPPPTQGSVDIAVGCPILEGWPASVEVTAPGPCQSRVGGHWTGPGGIRGGSEPIMTWEQKCWLQSPSISYTMPSGDLFGSSATAGVLTDETTTLSDCRGNPKYTLEERVYHAEGQANPFLCKKYGSCDGIIWIQYFLYDYATGDWVANTPFLQLFQSSFEVKDRKGNLIATLSHIGDWDPTGSECQERRWAVDFATREPEQSFSTPAEQWPLAEMVTVISVRDSTRRPSGLLSPSMCDLKGYFPLLLLLFFMVLAACVAMVQFLEFGLTPIRKFMMRLEDRLCPRRMRVPSKFEYG